MKCTHLINASHAELRSLCGLQLLPIYVCSYFVDITALKRRVVKSARLATVRPESAFVEIHIVLFQMEK